MLWLLDLGSVGTGYGDKPWCTGKQLPLGFNPIDLGSVVVWPRRFEHERLVNLSFGLERERKLASGGEGGPVGLKLGGPQIAVRKFYL